MVEPIRNKETSWCPCIYELGFWLLSAAYTCLVTTVVGVTAVANIPPVPDIPLFLTFVIYSLPAIDGFHGSVGVPAVASVPALAGLPVDAAVVGVAGVIAVVSVPTDPGVPILTGVFTYCTEQGDILLMLDYRTIVLLFFFCYRTIGISNIGMTISRNNRIIG